MNSYISCGLFVLLIMFIALLFIRRRKIERGVAAFYEKYSLVSTGNFPRSVREALGKGNWYCYEGELNGRTFFWWRGFTTSMTVVNNNVQNSIAHHLAVSFPPLSVSEDFMQLAINLKNSPSRFRDFFIYNTDKPYQAELLPDGHFLIVWNVLDRADIFEKKIAWLKENIK